jgi:glycosyltransferase involved in cell wall biosynthesis
MHLAIEAVGVKHSGGAVVLTDVLRATARCPFVHRITVFCSPVVTRKFDFPSSPKIWPIECAGAESTVSSRIWWLTQGLARQTDTLRPDALLCMNGIGISEVPTAAFVQQSLPFCSEALGVCTLATRIRIRVIAGLMKHSCRRAELVIAQTPTMSEWIQRAFGVPSSRISVVKPWGDDLGMNSEQSGDLELMHRTPSNLRLLYVGNTSSYKNLECLTHAMLQVRRHLPGATLFLTCPPDHYHCETDGVIGVGYLGGQRLRDAYCLTTAFITASLVESGNLTLVEALSAGTPILAADRPYARDLCGDSAAYFDPGDPESASSVIVGVLTNASKREQMGRRGLEVAVSERKGRPYDCLVDQLVSLARSSSARPRWRHLSKLEIDKFDTVKDAEKDYSEDTRVITHPTEGASRPKV